MSSKLFATVVAFGITLGTAACSSEPVDTSSSSEDAIMTAEEPAAPAPATPAPAAPAAEKDRFCEVPWPTTKGGPRPAESQDCIDPERECGDYPGVHHPLGYSRVSCVHVDAANVCDASQTNVWMFCKANGTSHAWTCPTGTVKVGTCTAPATPDEGDSNADDSQAEH